MEEMLLQWHSQYLHQLTRLKEIGHNVDARIERTLDRVEELAARLEGHPVAPAEQATPALQAGYVASVPQDIMAPGSHPEYNTQAEAAAPAVDPQAEQAEVGPISTQAPQA